MIILANKKFIDLSMMDDMGDYYIFRSKANTDWYLRYDKDTKEITHNGFDGSIAESIRRGDMIIIPSIQLDIEVNYANIS